MMSLPMCALSDSHRLSSVVSFSFALPPRSRLRFLLSSLEQRRARPRGRHLEASRRSAGGGDGLPPRRRSVAGRHGGDPSGEQGEGGSLPPLHAVDGHRQDTPRSHAQELPGAQDQGVTHCWLSSSAASTPVHDITPPPHSVHRSSRLCIARLPTVQFRTHCAASLSPHP